jgi:hypothetical protein
MSLISQSNRHVSATELCDKEFEMVAIQLMAWQVRISNRLIFFRLQPVHADWRNGAGSSGQRHRP